MVKQMKAEMVMGSPDYYNCAVTFGDSKVEWEVENYTKTGRKIRFGRIIPHGFDADGRWLIEVKHKYVDPETIVNVHIKES